MLFGYSRYLMESILTPYDNLEFFIRIVLSGFLGALIGLERANRNKEAGIRTHIIIAVTASVFMILSKYAFLDMLEITGGAKSADPSRIASQVVTGISFLCAGVIFRQGKYYIRGLTTAAGMWATASVGMAIGAGMYCVGVLETAVLVLMQILLHKHPVGNDALIVQEVRLKVVDETAMRAVMEELKGLHHGEIIQCEVSRETNGMKVKMTIRGTEPIKSDEIIRIVEADSRVKELGV